MRGETAVALFAVVGICFFLLPPLLTASVASKRGRDGLIWFIVALVWDLLFGGVLALVAPILGFGAFAAIIARDQPLTAAALGGGALALAAFAFIFAFLPLFLVVMFSGRNAQNAVIQNARLARMRRRRLQR